MKNLCYRIKNLFLKLKNTQNCNNFLDIFATILLFIAIFIGLPLCAAIFICALIYIMPYVLLLILAGFLLTIIICIPFVIIEAIKFLSSDDDEEAELNNWIDDDENN